MANSVAAADAELRVLDNTGPGSVGSTPAATEASGARPTSTPEGVTDADDSEECDGDAPVAQKTQFMSFLKSLSGFSGDLSQLSCPAFLLSGLSVHEYCAHWGEHPELLCSIPDQPTPALRMLAILRWQISTFFGAFHSRSLAGNEKKPFNPILGEIFRCSWTPEAATVPMSPAKAGSLPNASSKGPPVESIDGPNGLLRVGTARFPRTELFVEQVSHHPPMGAFYLCNEKRNVFVNGNCGQKTRFKTTYIKVDQTGHTVVQLVLPNGQVEDYFISLPELALRGLLSGSMFLELLGSTTVRSSTGWVALVSYLPKPWFGGDYHEVRGAIFAPIEGCEQAQPQPQTAVTPGIASLSSPPTSNNSASASPASPSRAAWSSPGKKLSAAPAAFTISGNWTRKTTVTDVSSGKVYLLFDAETQLRRLPILPTPDALQANESARLWGKVTEALKMKHYSVASKLKSKIENEQRALRKKREADGISWKPEHFVLCKTRGGAVVQNEAESSGNAAGQSRITLDPKGCVESFKNAAGGSSVPETLVAVGKALTQEDKNMQDHIWIHKDMINATE